MAPPTGTFTAEFGGFVDTTVGGVPVGGGVGFPPGVWGDWPNEEPQELVAKARRDRPSRMRGERVLRKIGIYL